MKAIVLSSGGVDSTTCLAMAVHELGKENVVTLSFEYGQRHCKELESAQKVADYYGVRHVVFNLTQIFSFSNCSLLSTGTEKPVHESYAEQISKNGEGKVSTYVPDDAAGNAYADCSVGFNNAMAQAINIGTYGLVSLRAPLNRWNKAQVVAKGLELKVPYELTWSCYDGGEKACGECGTCIDRKAAFEANGVKDPIEYVK